MSDTLLPINYLKSRDMRKSNLLIDISYKMSDIVFVIVIATINDVLNLINIYNISRTITLSQNNIALQQDIMLMQRFRANKLSYFIQFSKCTYITTTN